VEWFAVVKQDMNAAITNYASGTDGPFKPPGQSVAVPFNNIVTTLMTGMNDMFANKTSFNEPIASWDTSNVTTMYGMFYSASAYAFNQPIGAWNTGAVTNMNYMFMGATAFNQNISGWNVGAVVTKPPTNFSNGSALTAQNTPVWFPIVLVGTTIKYVGSAAAVPTSAPLFVQANPQGTGVEWFAVVKQDMKAAISSYASGTDGPFKPPGQSVAVEWRNIVTTLMTDMSSLFSGKSGFNYPIASWDTGAVTDMSYMFSTAAAFNQPIGAWNTGSVTTMKMMFYAHTAATGSAFNQPIGTWNTAAVTNMSYMFTYTRDFNKPIGAWNTGAVTDMSVMFYGAAAFNQPIGTWNTTAVTNMNSMFYDATAFNQNISGWNITNVSPKPPTEFVNTANSVLTAQNNPFVSAFAAPTLSGSITYSGNTASMTYAVAAGVTAVQVRKASDGSVITSGVTTSVNTSNQTASISVVLTENVSIVVVALGNASGRESAASATQSLLVQYAAPTISGSITYSGNTASMTYAVQSGVTRVSALKASDTTYSLYPSSAMGQTLANFPTLGAMKTWTFTISGSTGGASLVRASDTTKKPLYIDFRSDRVLLTQLNTGWGPDQSIMSGFHDLPRPNNRRMVFQLSW
jgi:surface protein